MPSRVLVVDVPSRPQCKRRVWWSSTRESGAFTTSASIKVRYVNKYEPSFQTSLLDLRFVGSYRSESVGCLPPSLYSSWASPDRMSVVRYDDGFLNTFIDEAGIYGWRASSFFAKKVTYGDVFETEICRRSGTLSAFANAWATWSRVRRCGWERSYLPITNIMTASVLLFEEMALRSSTRSFVHQLRYFDEMRGSRL